MALVQYLEESAALIAKAATPERAARVDAAIAAIVAALGADRPLLVCGNGGSASDAMHIAGELVGRFLKERRGLNCIALGADTATLTAWANDYDYAHVFAPQVEAYGRAGGVLLGIPTSGNSTKLLPEIGKTAGRG